MPASAQYTNGKFFESNIPGAVQTVYANYTAATAQAANTVINMIKAKKGMKFLSGKVKVSAFGTGRTANIGIAADTDKFLSGGSVAAAGLVDLANPDGFFYEFTADGAINFIVLGDTMPQDATVEMIINYTMNN